MVIQLKLTSCTHAKQITNETKLIGCLDKQMKRNEMLSNMLLLTTAAAIGFLLRLSCMSCADADVVVMFIVFSEVALVLSFDSFMFWPMKVTTQT